MGSDRQHQRFDYQKFDIMCVCLCAVLPFILDVRLVGAPDGVTQEGSHTGFLHLPSAVLAIILIARRIQPSLSLVDREVVFLCIHEIIVLFLLGMIGGKISVRVTAPGFDLTSQRQKVSRLPTEPPGLDLHFQNTHSPPDTCPSLFFLQRERDAQRSGD